MMNETGGFELAMHFIRQQRLEAPCLFRKVPFSLVLLLLFSFVLCCLPVADYWDEFVIRWGSGEEY